MRWGRGINSALREIGKKIRKEADFEARRRCWRKIKKKKTFGFLEGVPGVGCLVGQEDAPSSLWAPSLRSVDVFHTQLERDAALGW